MQWFVFAGLSPETGGGRGPSPGTGTTNLRDPFLGQGGTDVLLSCFTILNSGRDLITCCEMYFMLLFSGYICCFY